MQVLILYYSKGGNTKKLAERIGEGVEFVSGVKALLKSTQEVKKEDFVDSAGMIAGSPVYFGAMAWDLKRVFDEYVVVRNRWKTKWGRLLPLQEIRPVGRRPRLSPSSNACLFTA